MDPAQGGGDMKNILSLVAALTALAAVIIGPYVSLRIAKRQIKATVVSPKRQEWIDTFRGNIAEFLTLLKFLCLSFLCAPLGKQDREVNLKKLILLDFKMRLLINPKESDHLMLIEHTREAIDLVAKIATDRNLTEDKKLNDLSDRIISLSQSILKREWERVKQGE